MTLLLAPALPAQESAEPFVRGDANADGSIDLSDPLFLLAFLFLGGNPPSCGDSADSDDNGTLEMTDSIFLLNWLFGTCGEPPCPPPPAPSPSGLSYSRVGCRPDPTADSLSCVSFEPCLTSPYCPQELPPGAREVDFVRGDVDASGILDLTDGVHLLNWLFLQGPEPACLDAADTNDDGCIDPQDVLGYPVPGFCPFLDLGLCRPAPPYPACGPDPTADFLGCARSYCRP